MNPRKRLGEVLLEAGVIDETQLKAALGHQRQWGVRIGQALVDLKLATEPVIVEALAKKFGFEVARTDGLDPQALAQALKLLPREFAVRNNVLPIAADSSSVTVAMSDPSNLAIVDEIRFRTGRKVKVCIGGDHEIANAVNRHYPGGAAVEAIALDLEGDDSGAEALHDPFGGGSRDALEAFFSSSGENAGAQAQRQVPSTDAAAPSVERHAVPGPGSCAVPVAPPVAPASRAPSAAGGVAPPKPQPPAPQRAAPARPPSAVTPAAPAAMRTPAGAAPSGSPGAALPAASRPTGKFPKAVVGQQATAARGVEEDRAALLGTVPMGGLAPWPELGGESFAAAPALVDELGPGDAPPGSEPGGRALTPSELSILDALERLAGGAHAEPEIVKPTQAMAAMIRLLLRKRIVTEQEFLDELSKK